MSAICYMWQSGKISAPLKTFHECGDGPNATNPFLPCCGSGDICLNNGFCQHKSIPTGSSGIYAGACTDPTLTDSSCINRCRNQPNSEVVYVNGTWYCCGGDVSNPTCNDPQAPGFLDLSPFQLLQIGSIVDAGAGNSPEAFSKIPPTATIPAFTSGQSIAAIGTATPTGSFDPKAPVTIPPSSSSTTGTLAIPAPSSSANLAAPPSTAGPGTFSTGAVIGLAVGAVCLIALAAAGLWYCFFYKRRKAKERPRRNDASSSPGQILAVKRPTSAYYTYTPGSSSRSGGASSSSQSANTRQPPTPHSTTSPVSPLTPHGVSRFASRGARPRNQEVYEMQSPIVPVIHELPAESRPTEMMVNTSVEDSMAGGGPDRQLPVPPTPTAPQGGHTRGASDISRYQSILNTT